MRASSFVRSTLLTAVLVGLSAPLHAQLPVNAPSSGSRLHVWTSVGFDALGVRDGNQATPSRTLQLSASLNPGNGALGVRVTGWTVDRSRDAVGLSLPSQFSSTGLGVDVTYDLARGRTKPYALAGFGMAWLSRSDRLPSPIGSPAIDPSPVSAFSVTRGQSAYGAIGLGVQRKVLGLGLFTELRYARFTQDAGIARQVAPLMVGVRF